MKSFFRHFKLAYEEKIEEINILEELITNLKSRKNYSNEVLRKTEEKLKSIKKSDLILNFDVSCGVLKNIYDIKYDKDYKKLDEIIESTINLIVKLYDAVVDSEENKKIDKSNYTHNKNLKERFARDNNPLKKLELLNAKAANDLSLHNSKAEKKIEKLEKKYGNNENILNIVINLEKLATKNPTEKDIIRDIEILSKNKISKILSKSDTKIILNLIKKESIKRIKSKKITKEEIKLAEDILILKGQVNSLLLKKYANLEGDELWNILL